MSRALILQRDEQTDGRTDEQGDSYILYIIMKYNPLLKDFMILTRLELHYFPLINNSVVLVSYEKNACVVFRKCPPRADLFRVGDN